MKHDPILLHRRDGNGYTKCLKTEIEHHVMCDQSLNYFNFAFKRIHALYIPAATNLKMENLNKIYCLHNYEAHLFGIKYSNCGHLILHEC